MADMRREDAALVRLRLMAHRAFGAMVENRRGGSEEAQKDLDAIDWAIATIQNKIVRPQPDPGTGLMPCGCGGKAKLYVWQSNGGNISVTCSNCTIQITGIGDDEITERTIQNMRDVWNRAMSGGKDNG
jgi:hypothetical protein